MRTDRTRAHPTEPGWRMVRTEAARRDSWLYLLAGIIGLGLAVSRTASESESRCEAAGDRVVGRHGPRVEGVALLAVAGRDLAATVGRGGDLRLWDVAANTALPGSSREASRFGFGCLAAAPNGSPRLAVGGLDGTLWLFDLDDAEPLPSEGGHDRAIRAVVFEPGGDTLFSGGDDGTIRLWDPVTGAGRGILGRHARGGVEALAMRPAGDRLLSAGGDGQVIEWDLPSRTAVREWNPAVGRLDALAVEPGGRLVAVGGEAGTVVVRDLQAGVTRARLSGHQGAITAMGFLPDGVRLLTAGVDGTVRLWNVREGRCERIRRGHRGTVTTLAVAADGRFALTGGDDASLRAWDLGVTLGDRD